MDVHIKICLYIYHETDIGTNTLIDRGHRVHYSINQDTMDIFHYIHENPTLNLHEISKILDVPLSFLTQLQNNGLISQNDDCNRFPFRKIGKDTFKHITIECTRRCNLHCKHCCYKCGNPNDIDMDYSTLEKILEEAMKNGIQHLTITGGEPTINPDFINILKKADELNIPLTVFSNLYDCSPEQLDSFEKYHVQRVTTSLESDIPEIHDYFRGKIGSHKRTVNAIKKLVEKKVPVNVNFVIGMHNCNRINETLSFIRKLGAQCKIDIISPFGRASEMDLNYELIIKKIEEIKCRLNYDCGVCSDMLFISANGDAKMCPSINDKKYSFGNVNNSNFTLKKCKEECNELKLNNKKYPGCRARAYHMSHDIYGSDPIYDELVKHV